jgi:organic hydroperoxide reductase OsmC/OhrA
MAITRVTLRPRIVFQGSVPDQAKLDELHHQAHETCFIANSVTTKIAIEPVNSASSGSGQ